MADKCPKCGAGKNTRWKWRYDCGRTCLGSPNDLAATVGCFRRQLAAARSENKRLRGLAHGFPDAVHSAADAAAMQLWEEDRLVIEEPEPGDDSFSPNHSAFSQCRKIILKHYERLARPAAEPAKEK